MAQQPYSTAADVADRSAAKPLLGLKLFTMKSITRISAGLLSLTLAVAPFHDSATAVVQSQQQRDAPSPAKVAEPPQDAPVAGVAGEMKGFTETIPESLVEFEMVPVPEGEGMKPFYMGKHEVTWDEFAHWAYVRDVEKEIERIRARARKLRPSPPYDEVDRGFGFKDRPALGMSRLSAELYAEWLTEKTGRTYRLPTKKEWQHAFKLGYGSLEAEMSPEQLAEVAWYGANSEGRTQAPGTRKPNAIGIYDMLGNVAEWVTDTGQERHAIGGHFRSPADKVTSSAVEVETEAWNENYPNEPKSIWWFVDADFVGFRLVCEAEPQAGATTRGQPAAGTPQD